MYKNQITLLSIVLLICVHMVSWQPILAISDKRLCADEECKILISTGKTKITFSAGSPGMVSFKANSNVRIFSKEAGSDKSLWGIEVQGRKGYAPKDMIREDKMFVKRDDVKYEVPTEIADVPAKNKAQSTPVILPSEAPSATESSSTVPLKDAEKTAPPVLTSSIETPEPALDVAQDESSKLKATSNVENAIVEEKPVLEVKKDIESDKLNSAPKLEKVEQPSIEVKEKNVIDGKLEQIKEEKGETKHEESIKNPENASKEEITKTDTIDKMPLSSKAKGANIVETATAPGIKDSEFMYADVDAILDEATTLATPVVSIDKNETIENIRIDTKEEKKKITPQVENSENETNEYKENNPQELQLPAVKSIENETNAIKGNELPPIETGSEKINGINEKMELEKQMVPQETNVNKKENLSDPQEFTVPPVQNILNETNEEEINVNITGNEIKNETNEQIQYKPLDIPNEIAVAPEKLIKNETIDNKQDIIKENFLENTEKKEGKEPFTDAHKTPLHTIENPDESKIENETKVLNNDTESNPIEEKMENSTVLPSAIFDESTTTTEASQLARESDILNEVPQLQEPVGSNINNYTTTKILPNLNNEKGVFDNESTTQSVDTNENEKEIDDKSSLLRSNEKQQQTVDLSADHDNLLPIIFENQVPEHLPQYAEPLTEPDMDLNNQFDSNQYFRKLQEIQHEKEMSAENEQLEQSEEVETEANNSKNEEEYFVDSTSTAPIENINEDQMHDGYPTSSESQNGEISNEPVVALPSRTPPPISPVPFEESDSKEQGGLFATILGTVNSFWSSEKKESLSEDDELQSILFSEPKTSDLRAEVHETQYCEKQIHNNDCQCLELTHLSLEEWGDLAAAKVLEMGELLACFLFTAVTSLVFLFGYYCFCNSSQEGALLAKLNYLERSLLSKQKENIILKDDLAQTRHKLSSIEDNSFGSNDMVIALKLELEQAQEQNEHLKLQVHTLEKELVNAAEAGLELNKIVSDLLSNQNGDESIISSVEELQRQLNEQQNVILEINTNLAEKSRENSELQLMLAEQGARLNGEIASLQQDNDELEAEKANMQTRIEEIKNEFDEDITKALEGKNFEIKRLQNEINELQNKCELEHTKWQTSMAKVEALEECLKSLKKDPGVDINEVINAANVRAEILDIQKKYSSMKERLDVELDGKLLSENKLKLASEEVEKMKQNFHQSEKDKLEAQTRLEVLSNYFKEKETQLQKELSLKEAMWLKQQGETTSTVDRLTAMQEEINSLKSQNESLRAEIEAQVAANKAQIGTLQNRAHETWMAARQSERRCEEACAEASALRRKLTALAGGDGKINNNELNNAASPIHMESPASPLLGRLPPPRFLPPFQGPPPPFMVMPPPPFVPFGEMRPAPLGRIMSPPPPTGSSRHGMRPVAYSPSGRHAQQHDFDDEYNDDDDYEDEEDEDNRYRSRYDRGSDSWPRNRDDYSPSPRTNRSHSPADSRYNYSTNRDLISTYDTETDFSPPPSPRDRDSGLRRGSRSGSYREYSPQPPTSSSPINENHSGKKSSSKQSSANKDFAAINLSRIASYCSSSESNRDIRYKKGTGTGTDSERSSKKTHNGRQHGKSKGP